jgi:hypothetical protein
MALLRSQLSSLIFELVVKLPEKLKDVKPLRRRHRLPVFEVGLLGLPQVA